jgi:acetyl-CoA carboxylase carboxyl transferase subunit alpha
MVFLDFEKPIENLYDQLDKLKQVGEEGEVDVSESITNLEKKINITKKEIYENLSGWQKVQLSRHPERP